MNKEVDSELQPATVEILGKLIYHVCKCVDATFARKP